MLDKVGGSFNEEWDSEHFWGCVCVNPAHLINTHFELLSRNCAK